MTMPKVEPSSISDRDTHVAATAADRQESAITQGISRAPFARRPAAGRLGRCLQRDEMCVGRQAIGGAVLYPGHELEKGVGEIGMSVAGAERAESYPLWVGRSKATDRPIVLLAISCL